jgi:hypothetical protein
LPERNDYLLALSAHLSDESSCMNNATKTNKTYNGFAVEITDTTYLGLAMLIAESEDGQYEPVAVSSQCRRGSRNRAEGFAR